METSLAKAAKFYGQDRFDIVIYVGDGVWDGRASLHLGFRFIGIARDPDQVERLYAEKALQVFPDYLDHEIFLAALTNF
jgi:hypothetical protein